ncbi:hypothetical protein N1614_08255 [Adlercreutzia muris]|uniref:hypothetical protein n=1 Tax=Adlercreutzia muris TaxID=1796610 RepID=UPI0014784CB2|nr:hypothetical protein [Adlercreutzia muris]MCR2029290.1 hypothetical protein [Adlercreutzia muris]MCU7585335.1 hypothetical protein [Adlercreutzia muris]
MDSTQLSTVTVEAGQELVVVEAEPAPERPLKEKAIIAAVLAAVALVSLIVFANIASNPETYTGIIGTLDEKKGNVMVLATTTTAASAAISALPNDMGTPIADKLVDFSSYFMVILAVIYLEKFLLTTLGFLGFGILIPVACALFAVAVFLRRGTLTRVNLQRLGTKLAAFGLALALVVPVSVWLTDNVDATFDESLAAASAAAQEATEQLEENTQAAPQEDQGLLGGIANAVQDGWNGLTQGAQQALDSLGDQLNTMIDTLAVMIVTSCLIPLLVLILFLQLVKIITGLDFGGATAVMGAARTKGRAVASSLRRPVQKG